MKINPSCGWKTIIHITDFLRLHLQPSKNHGGELKAVTYAVHDPLIAAYRHSVKHVSLISVRDGTALDWYKQEHLRAQMSKTVLFGKIKDLQLIVWIFRGQLQCRMGGKRQGSIEAYPKFWNLNPVEKQAGEILRIPAWTETFELIRG